MNKPKRWGIALSLLALFGLALALRLINLQNPPIDFHPTRQLRSAIIARGMYYESLPQADPATRQTALALAAGMVVLEPPLLERLVASTYHLVGSEQVWLARIYTISAWLVGGAALYALARRLTSHAGGLAAAAFYLFFPFGVYASRSFQPDPLMVAGSALAAYALQRWNETPRWKWALLAGITSGAAALIKIQAAPILAAMLAVLVLHQAVTRGWRKTLRSPQPWLMAGLLVLPLAVYYLAFAPGTSTWLVYWRQEWVHDLLQPSFYVRWLIQIDKWAGLPVFLCALLGTLLFRGAGRWQVAAWWAGYALLGLAFPHHILTHDYYHLPAVPLIGISLAPLADALFQRLRTQPLLWRGAAAGVVLLAIFFPAWMARSTLLSQDYRPEAAGWLQIAAQLPNDGKIIALSHDYGVRLMYFGWREVEVWDLYDPMGSTPNLDSFQTYFQKKTDTYHYFLVTLPGALAEQTALQTTLYDNYLLLQDQGDLILFDLTQPAR